MSNRLLNISILATALLFLPATARPAIGAGEVAYDSTSFIINGERTFLVSGSMHYFRVPRELWPELFLRARRGGLNAISTYVAWNAHEREEGRFDFSGVNDLDTFLELAENMGLYIILRPGPYICSERSLGGFPAWLLTKPGLELRTDNPAFLKYVDRWFDRLIPVIARHQAGGGGGVILVQVENEFDLSGVDPERGRAYMEHLRDGLRRRGITVPLITCKGRLAGCIECANAFYPADDLGRLRAEQPGMPVFATEFWSGWYDTWGNPHNGRDPGDLENATWDFLADGGAGYNYYMYFGGTNFGNSGHYLQTTSYDWDAPLSETLGLTDNFYAARLPAEFAAGLAPLLTVSAPDTGTEVAAPSGLEVRVRRGPTGSILFLKNPGTETVRGEVSVDGRELGRAEVPPETVMPVIIDWEIRPGITLAAALSSVAGVYHGATRTVVVAYGPPGGRGLMRFRINERTVDVYLRYPRPGEVRLVGTGAVDIIVADRADAARAWHIPGFRNPVLLIGPDYLGVTFEHLGTSRAGIGMNKPGGRIGLYHDGRLTRMEPGRFIDPTALPRLTGWTVADEPVTEPDDSFGARSDQARSMTALGNGQAAYGWYRTHVSSDRARVAQLGFTDAGDRLTLFVNGLRIGASPHPPEDRTGPWPLWFTVPLTEGDNIVTVLADNLGLIKGPWQLGRPMETEAKGIYGPVLLDGREVTGWRFLGRLHGERNRWFDPEVVPDSVFRPLPPHPEAISFEDMGRRKSGGVRWFRVRFSLPEEFFRQGNPIKLAMDRMGKGSIWLNGRHMGRYWNIGPQFDYNLPAPWLARDNVLVIAEEDLAADPSAVALKWDMEAYLSLHEITSDSER